MTHPPYDLPADDEDGNHQRHRKTGQSPQFLSGNRAISLAALRERMGEEFLAEPASRPDILLENADEAARRDLIREVIDYVLAIESVTLSRLERAEIQDLIYRDL